MRRVRWFGASIVVLSTLLLGQLAPPVPAEAAESADVTESALPPAGPDDQRGPVSAEEVFARIREASDGELSAQIDHMLVETERAIAAGELSGPEFDAAVKQLDQLRDPGFRDAAIKEIRSLSDEDLAKATSEVLDRLEREDGGVVGAEGEEPPLSPPPVVEPGQEPNPTTASSGTPEAPVTDPALLNPFDEGGEAEVPSDSEPVPVVPDAEQGESTPARATDGDPAAWDFETRITDRESLDVFAKHYAAWLDEQVTELDPKVTDRGGSADSIERGDVGDEPEPENVERWIEPLDVCAGAILGTRPAPTVPTRPGTIYSPTPDTFVGSTAPHTVYPSGGASTGGVMSTRINPATGAREFLVQAHVMSSSLLIGFFRPEISIERLNGPLVTYSPDDANVTMKCYSNDAGRLFVTRGYVEAWVPFSLVAEPGFQARVDVTGRIFPRVLFFGADQSTVHVGPAPLRWTDTVVDAAGVVVDDSVIVDRNGDSADDLEGLLRPKLTDGVTTAIENAEGTFVAWPDPRDPPFQQPFVSLWLAKTDVQAPISADVDLWEIDKSGRERLLGASLRAPQTRLMGTFTVGPVNCAFKYKFSAWAYASAGVDVNNTDRYDLDGDLRQNNVHINTLGLVVLPIAWWPWNVIACTVIWITAAFVLPSIAEGFVEDQIEPFFEPGGLVDSTFANVDLRGKLAQGFALPNGNGIAIPPTASGGFSDTCVVYGCRGGDVALIDEGLEASMSLRITDRKSPRANRFPRRFPNVYRPTNPTPVTGLVHDHRDANGQPFSIGALLDPGALNQALRALTEGSRGPRTFGSPLPLNGILDQSFTFLGRPGKVSPTVAPMAVDLPSPDPVNFPMSLAVPDVRISYDDGSGPANPVVLGIDLFVGVNATQVSYNTIDPNFIVRTDTTVLNCHSLLWLICGKPGAGTPVTFTGIVDFLVAFVSDTLNTVIGNLPIPQLINGVDYANTRIQRRGATWAIYTDIVPAPRVELTGWYSKPWYGFNAVAAHLPGTGPVTYRWTVTDELAGGRVVHSSTSANPSLTLHMDGLARIRLQRPGLFQHSKWRRIVRATVTASRGGRSVSTSLTQVMDTEIW